MAEKKSTAFDQINAMQTIVYHGIHGQTFSSAMMAFLGKNISAGAFGTALNSVPWSRNFPFANTNDTDMDGIPDSLDGYFGPGAVAPF